MTVKSGFVNQFTARKGDENHNDFNLENALAIVFYVGVGLLIAKLIAIGAPNHPGLKLLGGAN